jgi:hypothetical protein
MNRKHCTAPYLKEIEPATITDPRISEVIQKLQQLAQEIRERHIVRRSSIFQRLAASLANQKNRHNQ